jgi:uncharacterized protein (DUF58 family)
MQDLLKKVRQLEIKTKNLSKHLFSGDYHSTFKGRGMSFSEVRSYQYGDDVRAIDWNVTARSNEPYIKLFEEEREMTVMLLIDVSASSFFGTQNAFKNEIITEVCAVLAFSAIQNNDKVGVIFFSDKIEKYIAPQKGRHHTLRIIRELLDFKPVQKGTSLDNAFVFLNNITKKRTICFVLSDFMTQGYEASLRVAARRHDMVGIQIFDPSEEKLPDVGLLPVTDAETGKLYWIDTSVATVRQQYAEGFEENKLFFRNTFLKTGADTISIRTTESYINALLRFFERRK